MTTQKGTTLEPLFARFESDQNKISDERKEVLDHISETISTHLQDHEKLDIIVVCTHNSRRSQLGEVLINILVNQFKIDNIVGYSGGMESTAFNHRMVQALNNQGLSLNVISGGTNPVYLLPSAMTFLKDHNMFSKKYDHEMNPKKDFMALMVCDHADENCPIVFGMKYRIPLRYTDPKAFDDTENESNAYSEKIFEIGREMYYIFSRL